jgi:hypothetical protein
MDAVDELSSTKIEGIEFKGNIDSSIASHHLLLE